MGWLGYVLVLVCVMYGLAALGALQRIANALQRLGDLADAQDRRAVEQYTYAVAERTPDTVRANALTRAQLRIAEAQHEVAQLQAFALADQTAYRDEQRRHMASCAKRYEAIMAGELALGETPVKH